MKVCLVIPVYNEREQLESSIRTLLSYCNGLTEWSIELVIANNGSNDGTTDIANHLSTVIPNVRHEFLAYKGRGRALRQVWANSDADILSYMDVDLSTDISFLPLLLRPLQSGEADVSTGSRLLRPELTTRGWKRDLISRCYNRLLRLFFAPTFSDAQCGFKAITRRAAEVLLPLIEDDAWFFDTELLLLAEHFGYRIHDLPVRWRDDTDSRVRIFPTVIADLQGVLRMKRKVRKWRYEKQKSATFAEKTL